MVLSYKKSTLKGSLKSLSQLLIKMFLTNIFINWFIGHMATLGCLKYKKRFSGGFGKNIFADFHRETWEKRSNAQSVGR